MLQIPNMYQFCNIYQICQKHGSKIHLYYSRSTSTYRSDKKYRYDRLYENFFRFLFDFKSRKVFLVKTNKMRNSEFPKVASIIGNKPFELIEI